MWSDKMSDDYNYSYENGKRTLYEYFKKSFKPTNEIIQKNKFFFDDLKLIKRIFVLGHSLSQVDLPYFKKVIESVEDKNAPWIVTYHTDEDYKNHVNSLLSINITHKQITLVKMESFKFIPPTLF